MYIYIYMYTSPSWDANRLVTQKAHIAAQVYLERLITDLREATLVPRMLYISPQNLAVFPYFLMANKGNDPQYRALSQVRELL